jgi:hypothetical protein
MKKLCLTLALIGSALPALAGPDIGVSVAIGQPGMYGRIDIGQVMPPLVAYPASPYPVYPTYPVYPAYPVYPPYPQPAVVYPRVFYPAPVRLAPPPVYRPLPAVRPWRPYPYGGPAPHAYDRLGAPVTLVRDGGYARPLPGAYGRGPHPRHERRD